MAVDVEVTEMPAHHAAGSQPRRPKSDIALAAMRRASSLVC
jgi:hypothetical protein